MTAKHEDHAAVQGMETQINKGIGSSTSGLQTRGHYVPVDQEPSNAGWGIVHLYRDNDETTSLYAQPPPELWNDGSAPHTNKHGSKPHPPPKDEDCTTLCILAVPSYLGPSDFLGWVGEKTRDAVSHFRMVRTGKQNRYMVLMKFRDGKTARAWQGEWNGRVFNSMEPETCHVVFLKSVEVVHNDGAESSVNSQTPEDGSASGHPPTPTRTYPTIASDPFTSSQTTSSKPLPPPTPSLLELPTCPVCLERMDETTGLLTILCQHVFHCTCLQKWSGGGCPVCRYTFDDFSSAVAKSGKTKKKKIKVRSKYKSVNTLAGGDEYEPCDDDYDGLLECENADCEVDALGENALWQCLICGRVGCGRYEGKHAFKHFEASGHSFAMDLESKRVWDYKSDGYVHRILQDSHQAEEKSPSRRIIGREDYEDEKDEGREALGLEYTHLLTSQLESQRVYFEGVVERAVDKAALAARDAERALEASKSASGELDVLREGVKELRRQNGEHEKEKERLEKKARKFEDVARIVQKQIAEERETNKGLLERVTFLNSQVENLAVEKKELEEMNHDLMMNFAAEEKVKELDAGYQEKGLLQEGEIQEGSLTTEKEKKEATATKRRKGKGKRKEGELVEPARPQQPGG